MRFMAYSLQMFVVPGEQAREMLRRFQGKDFFQAGPVAGWAGRVPAYCAKPWAPSLARQTLGASATVAFPEDQKLRLIAFAVNSCLRQKGGKREREGTSSFLY